MIRDEATLAQVRAANPETSTWLSANAGSGKTRVLTDRVALLLLKGVRPEKILCLTYTKAAASEMQNRLFARLGAWAMMPDAALSESLAALIEDSTPPTPQQLSEARRLFAKAVETPGGLKIQTIHSFCAAILRRFPLEAGVSPNFREMDSRQSRQLVADTLENLAEDDPDLVRGFGRYFSGDDLTGLAGEILAHRARFFEPFDATALRNELHLPADLDESALLDRVFLGSEATVISDILPELRAGKSTDEKLANALASHDWSRPDLALLQSAEGLFLTGKDAKDPFSLKNSPPTKDTKAALGSRLDPFDQLRHRVADARPLRLGLASLQRAKMLHRFAAALIPRIDAEKARKGWLDFDDLIQRTTALLSHSRAAAWVLYRLDGGIDHILVDEAQDTAPEQWKVVKSLADEFTFGDSARADIHRTIFVVGDPKQSIYSFQGADPEGFSRMRDYFHDALGRVEKPFQSRDLRYSFRSSNPILTLVDHLFSADTQQGMGKEVEHIAFKADQPGRVDLWPWIDPSTKADDGDWSDPVDTVSDDHHAVRLARKIAEFIADRLAHGQIDQETASGTTIRRIRAGDFLILVQRRSTLFHEIIRECKIQKLPIAGADRLQIGGELGVKDLVALLSWVATPEDDLSLAAVLRSPIGGFSEDQLFRLAYGRKSYLRERLEAAKAEYPALYDMLSDLRSQADYLRPYELLERALTRHGLRRKLVARLGAEAEDGIDALLEQAMQFETGNTAGLTDFLAWLSREEVEIKRQADSLGDQIRVMTVHGAKGLEAPIVILPDTGNMRPPRQNDILASEAGAYWRANAGERPEIEQHLADAFDAKQREERRRLLYVAVTRAESWLVVCGGGEAPNTDRGAWYGDIEATLQSLPGTRQEPDLMRLEHGIWPSDITVPPDMKAASAYAALPSWVSERPAIPPDPETPLLPSDLGGAKALAMETAPEAYSEEEALARGTRIHLALEHLPHIPAANWDRATDDLFPALDSAEKAEMQALVRALLADPATAFILAPDALAEVSVTARLAELGNRQISGAIDRLIVSEDSVLAVDFKSNRIVPNHPEDVPDGLLRQMGAYAAALAQIYPRHRIDTAILWTETQNLMRLPHEIVRKALSDAHIS